MNITLITDILPDNDYTAGQVLRNVLRHVGADNLSIFWINQSLLDRPREDSHLPITREYRFAFQGWLGPFLHRVVTRLGRLSRLSLLIQLVLTLWFCVTIAASIIKARRRTANTDYVWLVLQGEKLLIVYTLLSLFETRPVILQQWDPISWWMSNRNHRPVVIRFMKRCLEWLQRRVWLNIVPSPQWEAALQTAGRNAVRVDNFFSEEELRPGLSNVRVHTPGKLNVVFIGQLYANTELDQCLSIVKRNAHRLRVQPVLHYFGSGRPDSHRGMEVATYGYRPRMEIVDTIAKWDVALLPYPCDEKFSETALLSFPSKSRVYMAAGLPILAYAPAESSVERFFSENYRPYYMNVGQNEDATEFLAGCLDVCPERLRVRREHARSVVQRWFSEEAEVNRLLSLLQA